MKYLSLLLCFFGMAAQAQLLQPVQWTADIQPAQARVGDTVTVRFMATIQPNWYLYSSDFDPELGPVVTKFAFEPDVSYSLVDTLMPDHPKKKFDDLWGGEYTYFTEKGLFTQRIRLLSKDLKLAATMTGQTCSDLDGKCIPIEESFNLGKSHIAIEGEGSIAPAPTAVKDAPKTEDAGQFSASANSSALSLPMFMFYAFLAGLAAIFTPCVFPMIPLTVSFFSNKGVGQAIFYGFSIVLIYTVIGAILAPLLGSDAANVISTHWIPNLIFFTIFILFAISFFGMFDIELPSSLVNKMDKAADTKGGYMGVFFMAFTLALVSFSCTGPIVGSILVASAMGEMLRPIAGMAAFGSAFALPFMIFALFPRLLDGLPKSGGWLNAVKVTLGFIELALAFKFLSMIDLVYHLGILDRDVNIAIWIAIASFMGLYYLGKIQLPHDSPMDKVSVPRMLLALACFTFVIYLIPGMFGAPLKALSGVLPPSQTHDFDLREISRVAPTSTDEVKYGDIFEMPHGFSGYFDYKEGMEAARKAGKPVMLDFTGHGCANCRKMEDNVWVDPQVKKRLQQDWVIIELYVDDPTLLPENEWVTTADGKVKKTIGAVNMHFETTMFQNNAQPLYVLLDHNGNLLANGKGYDPDPSSFAAFLDAGLQQFKASQK